jgi:prolyl oligopeptidase
MKNSGYFTALKEKARFMTRSCIIFASMLVASVQLVGQRLPYPQAHKVSQVDTYFGVQVQDPYRWFENDTAKDVAAWVAAENKVTFGYLENIPFRERVRERLTKLWNYPKYTQPWREGTNYFFTKNNGLQNQSVVYIQKSLEATPEVFLDPNTFSSDGTVALSGLTLSHGGAYCAYSISRSGSDWSEIHVLDVAAKKTLPDVLRWVKFSGIAWYNNGFYYSRYDAPPDTGKALTSKNEYHKVYYHRLGTDQGQDDLVHADPEHPQRLFGCSVTDDERFLFLSESQAGSKGNTLSVRDLTKAGAPFTPLCTTFEDQIWPVDKVGDKLLVFTKKNAPNGKVMLVDPSSPAEQTWKVIMPEQPEVLSSVVTAGGKIIATYMKDVTPRVYVYSTDGTRENEISLPTLGMVSGFRGKKEDAAVFCTMTSFTTPATIYRYDIPSKTLTLFRKPEIDFDPEAYVTRQVFFKSKDSTRIPMFIVHKKGITLDGSTPTLLYGYGGFNASMTPSFNVGRLLWLEQGGIYAVANLRGGSEYGEKWHEAGVGLKKQNVFDDFIGAAEYLIRERYTSPQKLAVQGVSNGGLLIGAVINQRPDLFRVALPGVGVMDMLRFQKFTIGWAWIEDYGSSDDSLDFRNLYSYSPLHNIRAGTAYPAVLATTADHDDRVVPAHSFKYIATLQENYRGENPILIRIETKAGHGSGKPTSKIIEEGADIYTFTFHNLGMTPNY